MRAARMDVPDRDTQRKPVIQDRTGQEELAAGVDVADQTAIDFVERVLGKPGGR
jgi:hypothetical protein